jgi:hypothetical protein
MSTSLALAFSRIWILATIQDKCDHAILHINMNSIQDQAYRILFCEIPLKHWSSDCITENALLFRFLKDENELCQELELRLYEGSYNAVVSIHKKNGELWNDQGVIIWNWHLNDNISWNPGYVVDRIITMRRIL